jgi:hypothetical protein
VSWEGGIGAGVGLRAATAPAAVFSASVRRHEGAVSFGISAAAVLPAELVELDVAPRVGGGDLSVNAAWRPEVALGFELCGEAGVGLLLFEDRQGEPLGAPVPVPRAAARLSWNSPAVGGVEVEPYGRGPRSGGAPLRPQREPRPFARSRRRRCARAVRRWQIARRGDPTGSVSA